MFASLSTTLLPLQLPACFPFSSPQRLVSVWENLAELLILKGRSYVLLPSFLLLLHRLIRLSLAEGTSCQLSLSTVKPKPGRMLNPKTLGLRMPVRTRSLSFNNRPKFLLKGSPPPLSLVDGVDLIPNIGQIVG